MSFFIHEARSSLGTRTCGSVEALSDREAGSEAIGHTATLSASQLGSGIRSHRTHGDTGAHLGRVQSCRTRDSVGAHLDKEARSGAVGHVAAPEPTSAERHGSELYGTWTHALLLVLS
jgi:hypothetical protein